MSHGLKLQNSLTIQMIRNMPLSKVHKKFLVSLAHNLKPFVTIGQNGITDNVNTELEIALDFHELVKVKIASGDREERKEMIQILCEKSSAEIVQAIGKTVTLFRRNDKKPKIEF